MVFWVISSSCYNDLFWLRQCNIVVGRSNAINIAERLGVPSIVVHNARELYGAASAEIDEVTDYTYNILVII